MIAAQEKPDYGYYQLPEMPERLQDYPADPAPQPGARCERRARLVITALLLSVFALGIVYVLVNAFTTNIGYRLENVKHQVAALQAENQSLEVLVGRQDSLARIEAVAIAELGMVAPTEENTLQVAIGTPAAAPAAETGTPGATAPNPPPAGAEIAHRADPSLLEVLLGFICGREPGAETTRAG